MRCRLSRTADVPSHTSRAAIDALIEESKNSRCSRSGRSVRSADDPGCAGASEVSEGELPCRTRRSWFAAVRGVDLSTHVFAAEGKYDQQSCYAGPLHLIQHAEGVRSGSYVVVGMMNGAEGSPFQMISGRCVGAFSIVGGQLDDNGSCDFVNAAGEMTANDFTERHATGSDLFALVDRLDRQLSRLHERSPRRVGSSSRSTT
jgi:hypothetical protein